MAELIYGLKNENLVHVDNVKQGLECGCVCPNCGSKLIAKQGKINKHHFAHESKECDISVAQETALHYLAKEILSKSKKIILPKVIIEDKFAFYDRHTYDNILFSNYNIINDINLFHKLEKYQHTNKIIDNIIIEKYLEDIKPDILLEIEGKKLIIEIAVTHFIDRNKKQKIFNLDIPTIEIDLSSYKDKINDLDRYELEKILIKQTKHKNWIYYKNIYKDIGDIKMVNNKIVNKFLEIKEYWLNNFSADYRSCYEDYCQKDKYINSFWEKQWISKIMPMPWFANYPINGDILYNGDRRRWQSMILNKIYYSKNGTSQDEIIKYITEQNFLKIFDNDYNNPYRYTLSFEDRQNVLMKKTNRYQVIRDYYHFLQQQNIIDRNGKWIYNCINKI